MTNGRIKVRTIIANVIRDAQLKNVNHLIDSMIEWAYEAESLIGSYDTFVRKECIIKFRNYKAKLPNDLYQFIALKVSGQFPEVTNRDFRYFHKNSPHLATTGTEFSSLDLNQISAAVNTDGTQITTPKFTIENGWVHVSGIAKDATEGISYMAFDLDDEGFPLIKDGHEKAVVAYILWKLTVAPLIRGEVNAGVHDRLENRWYFLCGQARGEDEMPNAKQLEYIASIYHQLLPLPNKNFF
jgi:hypothetical protein